MKSILFFSSDMLCAAMAAAMAHARATQDLKIVAGCVGNPVITQEILQFMRQKGLKIPSDILSLEDVESRVFDIVIHVGRATLSPKFSGNPILVQWNLKQEAGYTEGCCGALYSPLNELVTHLFEEGYLAALLQARRNLFLILDNLREGIMAHDLNRRIFYFNKAAEEITGYKKEEVLGRDCHEVFPNKFCGKSCRFCNGINKIPLSPYSYDISVQTKDGSQKRLGMSVVPIFAFEGEGKKTEEVLGVLATFVDNTREFELSSRLGELKEFAGIVGNSPAMLELYEIIRDVANSDIPVLIQGESGTGKELVAAAIHNESHRSQHLFVPVNCAALPDSLLESELFGHVKGAFTGAIRDKKGRFELADGGTLFLDEIGDISPAMQAKLLRVLQDGVFERVGGEKSIRVNVRIISATNKDLREEVKAGRFREDLFYRICVMPIWLPPLRERAADIPLLVEHLLERIKKTSSLAYEPSVTHEVMDIFLQYHWPGNVRELMNCLQYAVVRARGRAMEPQHLPSAILSALENPGLVPVQSRPFNTSGQPLERRLKGNESLFLRPRTSIVTPQRIQEALQRFNGNRTLAAKALGVSRATFYRLLNKYDSTFRD